MRRSHPRPFTVALYWLTLTSFVTGSLLFAASGSSRPITIPDLHNTGVDDDNVALAAFILDSHYQLSLPGGKTSPVQTMVYPGVANNRLGRWLVPTQALPPQKAAGDYVWSTFFIMPKDADPNGAVLTGRWAADRAGRDILVNGKSSGQTAAGAFTWSDFTLNGPFRSGENTLQFVVRNSGTGPDALRVEFTGASASAAPAAPALAPQDNPAPPAVSVVPSAQFLVAGGTANIVVTYADPTANPPPYGHQIIVNWGDGSPLQYLPLNSGIGTVPASYTYPMAGNYTVTVTFAAQYLDLVFGTATTPATVVGNPLQLPVQPTVTFSSATYSVAENAGNMTITVNLSAASQQQVIVSYATSAGTAIPGTNYEDISGTLFFPPGATQQSFNVGILDDGINSPNKTVNLNLSSPANATLVNPSTAVLAIQDADRQPTVQFESATFIAMENASSLTIPVTLNNASGYAVTVTYNTADGTALAGTNYTAEVNQQLTFSPGTTTQNITIPILNDGIVGPNTYFSVTLSAPSNATLVPSLTQARITIVDSACVVTVSTSTSCGLESNGTAGLFTLTRSGDTTADLSVNYVLTSNGANVGASGTPSYAPSGSVTIPAGSSSAPLPITPTDDNVLEGTQSLTLTLPGGTYQPGSPSNAYLTIVDTLFWYQNANPGKNIPNLAQTYNDYLVGDTNWYNKSPYYKFTLQNLGLDDCWFVAAVSALAYRPGRASEIVNMIQDLGNGAYFVIFPGPLGGQVEGQVGQSEVGKYGQSNGTWLAILEKEFSQVAAGNSDPYTYLDTGKLDIGVGTRYLTGHNDTLYWLISWGANPIRSMLSTGVQANKVMVAGSSSLVNNGKNINGILAPHVYSVLDYRPPSDPTYPDMVLLRNPWGQQEYGQLDPKSKPPDGTNDGIFWMPLSAFDACFMGLSVED